MKNSKSMIYLLVALVALTVVVGVGMVFFFQKDSPKVAAASGTAPATTTAIPGTPLPDQFDPVEWTRNPQTAPLQAPATGTNNEGFTVTLPPSPNTATTSTLPPSPGASFPGDVAAPVAKPVVSEIKPAKPVAVKPAVKPAGKTVKVTEYWVQVASFKDRFQAENSAKSLESQGLKGILSTATVNGVAVVRVRVGPYGSQAEADKLLGKIKETEEFKGSYVSRAVATRTP